MRLLIDVIAKTTQGPGTDIYNNILVLIEIYSNLICIKIMDMIRYVIIIQFCRRNVEFYIDYFYIGALIAQLRSKLLPSWPDKGNCVSSQNVLFLKITPHKIKSFKQLKSFRKINFRYLLLWYLELLVLKQYSYNHCDKNNKTY